MARLSNNTALNYVASSLGSSFPQLMVKKTVTFTGGAGAGAQNGTVAICTVTNGSVELSIIPVCTTNLVGAATVSMGSATAVQGMIANTTATDIDAGEIWLSNSPADLPETSAVKKFVTKSDIILTVTAAAITAGVIDFYIFYRPIATDAIVS